MHDAASARALSSSDDDHIRRFAALFGTRRDAYGMELNGKGAWVKEPLTDEVLRQHLNGQIRIGIGNFEPGSDHVTCGCIDLDFDDAQAAFGLQSHLKHFSIVSHVERSRRKGWHVWVFFLAPVQAWKVRAVLRSACVQELGDKLPEIFPKQDRISGDGFGNFVFLPLQGASLKDDRTAFYELGEDGQPKKANWRIEGLALVDPRVLDEVVEINELRSDDVSQNGAGTPPVSGAQTTDLHALVGRAIRFLADPRAIGRNRVGFALACKLRDAGLSEADAQSYMLEYQSAVTGLKSEPYTVDEALGSLKSAFKRPPRPPPPPATAPPEAVPGGPLPRIFTTNRPLRDIVDDAVAAVHVRNDPPSVFQQSISIVRVCTDEKDRPVIQRMEESKVVETLTRSADFLRVMQGGKIGHTPPPPVVANTVLALRSWPFPPLAGITEIPLLRPDGSILSTPGYDSATQLLYVPAPGLVVPPIPTSPTEGELKAAVALCLEVFCDFPFADEPSHANAIGLLMTPTLHPAIEGNIPLGVVDSPRIGTGKTLLVSAIALINTERQATVMSVPETEEEWRKQLTSELVSGASFLPIDNVDGTLKSSTLARFLTCGIWKDRLLGGNEMPELEQRMTPCATGNNIAVVGDLRRRVYRIRLDAQHSKPWTRGGFQHPDLLAWVQAHRGELIAAILTIARAWFVAGKPTAPSAKFGGFQSWAGVVGGVLAHAGLKHFLGNQDEFFEQSSDEDAEWEQFLTAWHVEFGAKPIGVAQVVERIQTSAPLKDSLPGYLAEFVLASPGKSLSRRLGKALAAHCETRFGDAGLHLRRAGKDGHAKTVQWRVQTKEEAQSEGL